jgi:dTDP-4-dehydrorhamnose reductase
LVVRTSSFFGPWDDANFVTITLRKIAAGFRVVAASDLVMTPTYVPDLVHASLDLLIDGEQGLWHVTNGTAITWFDLARRTAELANLDAGIVEGCPVQALGLTARRPPYSALGSERGLLLPSLDDALARYFQDCEIEWAEQTA